jgi:ParB family chromosome partitioning protein
MSKPLGGLGRGLGALIPQAIQPTIETGVKAGEAIDLDTAHGLRILEISPDAIVENPHQPRLFFNEEDLHDLKMSIQEHGILQPLVVTKKSPGAYELIAGERRLRASRAIGLKVVPVIVRDEITEQKEVMAIHTARQIISIKSTGPEKSPMQGWLTILKNVLN